MITVVYRQTQCVTEMNAYIYYIIYYVLIYLSCLLLYAGRGLDIQSVDLVINFDIPRIASDYIHRVGRTSRGTDKPGRAVSLVTPHDMDLITAVETLTSIQLQKSEEIDEEKDIVPILNEVAKAKKEAQLLLMEQGFDEKLQVFKERKTTQRKKSLRQQLAAK